MNGIFSDLLEKCAIWFLYVFIDSKAPLNRNIMKKRENQVAWLKRIDAINTTYSYEQLRQIVSDGIIKKYNKTPAQMLTDIYNTATGSNGVSSVITDETKKANENLKNLSVTTTTGTETKSENFWGSVSSVLNFLEELLKLFGLGKPSDIQPTAAEWNSPNSSSTSLSSVGDILPWAMGAGIIWFLATSPNTDKNKKKKKD